jgi:hypothetical protein
MNEQNPKPSTTHPTTTVQRLRRCRPELRSPRNFRVLSAKEKAKLDIFPPPRTFVVWGHLLRRVIRLGKRSRRRTRKFGDENLNCQSARGANSTQPCLVSAFARLSVGRGQSYPAFRFRDDVGDGVIRVTFAMFMQCPLRCKLRTFRCFGAIDASGRFC